MHTRNQKLAQSAYQRVSQRAISDKYKTAAKKFPALIHTCGLAQAVAFGMAKKDYHEYLDDLAVVLQTLQYPVTTRSELDARSRQAGLIEYLRLSRDAIDVGSWLKRYVEAVSPEPEDDNA